MLIIANKEILQMNFKNPKKTQFRKLFSAYPNAIFRSVVISLQLLHAK